MAVYTHITDEELTHFLADFEVGELLSFKGIAEGVENSNYLVHTGKGTFILTLYEKRVNADDLPFFLQLMDHLAAAGLSCPVPVQDGNGQALKTLAGRPAALITFLEGISVTKPDATHCGALGGALAAFHGASASFPLSRQNALSVQGWRGLFETCRTRADEIAPGLEELIETELRELEALWPSDLPRGIIHADLFPDNVFFLDHAISGLIDFYFACEDMLSYDLAICLNAWCFEPDQSLNITKARRLLTSYAASRPLSEREYDAFPLLARGAALRFLLTRLHDWLHTDANAFVTRHDPMEYVRKLKFHQNIKSASEYGLDRTL